MRLAIHLPNMHIVSFTESDNLHDVLERNSDSTLMGWFKLNQSDVSAHIIKYEDIPAIIRGPRGRVAGLDAQGHLELSEECNLYIPVTWSDTVFGCCF